MRVRITKAEKEFLIIAEMPAVNRLIKSMKEEDDFTIEEYAQMVMRAIHPYVRWNIYDAKATIAKNCRISEMFFDGSGTLDVWIEFLAFDALEGAYQCGVYLTDIWNLNEDNRDELKRHMYINSFTTCDQKH